MTEIWKEWVGQIVAGRFPLRQLLASTEHSAVFLTDSPDPEHPKAAIKLVPCAPAAAELELSCLHLTSKLSHPNLLQVFHSGRCRLRSKDLLYLVIEYADENLSQVLAQRPLTGEETRDMLEPVLDALEYLHGKGFVHGHIKPTNILATGDKLKISADGICRMAQSRTGIQKTSPYMAPEAPTTGISPVGDVWSVGMTLVETLTQQLPVWQPVQSADPIVPDTLPAPFLEIARHCLRRDPQRRWTIGDIAAKLNPESAVAERSRVSAAAAAGAQASAASAALAQQPQPAAPLSASSVDPLSVPLSTVPPIRTPRSSAVPPRPSVKSKPVREQARPASKMRYFIPAAAAAVIVAAIVVVPRLFNFRPETPASTQTSQAKETPTARVPQQPARPAAQSSAPVKQQAKPEQHAQAKTDESVRLPETQPPAQSPLVTASEKEKTGAEPAPGAASPEPITAAKTTSGGTKGEVLDQVLPDVSDKARETIQGTVRISVKVHVDAAGNVAAAELDSPGPSKFFADLALQAAKRWLFSPPEVDGHSVASEWVLRFDFTPTDTKVYPLQTAP